MTKNQVFSWFFIALFLFLIYQFYRILSPFLLSLFWAGILVLLLYPVYEKLSNVLKHRTGIASLIMTFLSTFLIVLPLLLVFAVLAVDIFDIYQSLQNKIEVSSLESFFNKIKAVIPVSIFEQLEKKFDTGDLTPHDIVIKSLGTISGYALAEIQSLAENLTGLIIDFAIMIFAVFFFFRDGKIMLAKLKYLIPMKLEQKDKIFKKFYDVLNAVILGVMVTAAVQGVLMGLTFWILGISYGVLAGVLTFVFSLLPVGGAVFVWLPVGIYFLATGATYKGIALLLLGGLVVSSVDNFLKPLIIGGRVKVPTLFLFLSILGSLGVFGFSGIILGPVLLVVLMSFIDIYRGEYLDPEHS